MPFAATARSILMGAALAAPAQAQPPPVPAPQTPTPQADSRPWVPVKTSPQAGPPAYPQPPAAPAPAPAAAPVPAPARDVPPAPPIPPPPALGQADETTTTTTTTRKSGGIVISNNAAGTSTVVQVGNYGWGASGSAAPAPASYARPARDFATPPTDAGGVAPAPAVGTGYTDQMVPLAQATRLDLERPGLCKRQLYAWFPGQRALATPRAAVPTSFSIALPAAPAAAPVYLAPAPQAAPVYYAPAPAAAPVYATPAAPRKCCLDWLKGR